MAMLKNIHLLSDVGEKERSMMDHAALEHARHSNITFKIQEVTPKRIVIQVIQGKSSNGHYFDQKRLIEIVHETFNRFFKDRKILVHAIPYRVSPANVVTVDWINKRMLETGTKLKTIAEDTGLDYSHLSSLASGDKPLSQPLKALFYYYFSAMKTA